MHHSLENWKAAILTSPLDNTLRLVFADWLDENNQPEWAQFIRVQTEIHNLKKLTDNLHLQEKELFGHFWKMTKKDLIPVLLRYDLLRSNEVDLCSVRSPTPTLRCRRGFGDSISCGLQCFMHSAEKLFKLQPITQVRIVNLNAGNTHGLLSPITSWPSWSWVEGEDFYAVTNQVPSEIFKRLRGPKPIFHNSFIYRNELEALIDLSRAAVNYGRFKAGLPEIEF